MTYRKLSVNLFAIFLLVGAARADVAPDPGFKRVTIPFKLETKVDFSAYRFFIESAIDMREITVKKDEPNEISPMGGGAAFASGTLWAIPKKSMENLEDAKELRRAVRAGKVEGAVELLKHSFYRTVREAEAGKQSSPTYRLERDGEKGIKAVKISADEPISAPPTNVKTEDSHSVGWLPSVAAGLFIFVGVVFFGLRLFRR